MQQRYLRLLIQLHLLPELLLTLVLHIPPSLIHNVPSLLPSLINLLESSTLLSLQQRDSVRQQPQVVLSTLAGQLGSHELLMQGCIVILLVRRQVNIIEVALLLLLLVLPLAIHVILRALLILRLLIPILIVHVRPLVRWLLEVAAVTVFLRHLLLLLIQLVLVVVIHISRS